MMKRILITGGAGFLGSHLCERLLSCGNDIVCLDNFFTGNKDNVAHLLRNPHFELIRHDIINPVYLEVDEIYNLACPASPVQYQLNPIKTIKTNVMGVINVLGIAKRVKAKYCRLRLQKYTAIPTFIRRTNPIGEGSIQLEFAVVTMKAKEPRNV